MEGDVRVLIFFGVEGEGGGEGGMLRVCARYCIVQCTEYGFEEWDAGMPG